MRKKVLAAFACAALAMSSSNASATLINVSAAGDFDDGGLVYFENGTYHSTKESTWNVAFQFDTSNLIQTSITGCCFIDPKSPVGSSPYYGSEYDWSASSGTAPPVTWGSINITKSFFVDGEAVPVRNTGQFDLSGATGFKFIIDANQYEYWISGDGWGLTFGFGNYSGQPLGSFLPATSQPLTAETPVNIDRNKGSTFGIYGGDVFPAVVVPGEGAQYYSGSPYTVTLSSGPVPEPSTWALMLLGAFGAGAILRRYKSTLTNA